MGTTPPCRRGGPEGAAGWWVLLCLWSARMRGWQWRGPPPFHSCLPPPRGSGARRVPSGICAPAVLVACCATALVMACVAAVICRRWRLPRVLAFGHVRRCLQGRRVSVGVARRNG
ncbi:hypothetical protein BS78_06G181200 [Paspalum vaginatum]|nr:hypothetical protein BS78_06G181200 [Paspalum vaginatum]